MNVWGCLLGGIIVLIVLFHIIGWFLPIHTLHRKFTRLLQILDTICNHYGWNYWIESGTLLGAVRSQNIIPWDDDADVSMMLEDCTKLIQEKEALRVKYGVEVAFVEEHQIYKLYLPGDYSAWIDIFPRTLSNQQYILSGEKARKVWPGQWFDKDALTGYRMYRLGNLSVRGPVETTKYLERLYGKQWRVPKQTNVHTFQSFYLLVCKSKWYYPTIVVVLVAFLVALKQKY